MTDKNNPDKKPLDITYDNTKVYVKFSDIHGRGVFAKKPIELNEIVEILDHSNKL